MKLYLGLLGSTDAVLSQARGSKSMNKSYFESQRLQTPPTLGFLDPQGKMLPPPLNSVRLLRWEQSLQAFRPDVKHAPI